MLRSRLSLCVERIALPALGRPAKAVKSSRGEDMVTIEGYTVQMAGVTIACGLDEGEKASAGSEAGVESPAEPRVLPAHQW